MTVASKFRRSKLTQLSVRCTSKAFARKCIQCPFVATVMHSKRQGFVNAKIHTLGIIKADINIKILRCMSRFLRNIDEHQKLQNESS